MFLCSGMPLNNKFRMNDRMVVNDGTQQVSCQKQRHVWISTNSLLSQQRLFPCFITICSDLRLNPPPFKDLFLQWATPKPCLESLLLLPEFSLMDIDSSLRGGKKVEETRWRPCFKEDQMYIIGFERIFPSLSIHITFPFFTSLLLACAVSLLHASLIKGKGVIQCLRIEGKALYTWEGIWRPSGGAKNDKRKRYRNKRYGGRWNRKG